MTRPRAQFKTPVGYLVPLREDNKPARSYVLVFTRWIRTNDVFALLPAASTFTGHDIPFRKAEVLSFPLIRSGLRRLPQALFPRGLLTSFDWSKGKPEDFLAMFVKRYGRKGYYLALHGAMLILREGKPPRKPFFGMPVGAGSLWRTRRTTILVDLDSLLRNQALQGLQFVTSDIGTVAGTLSHESGVLAGRGMQWDSARGHLLSPEESVEAYQEQRLEMLDRIANILFRRPVHFARMPVVGPMVRQRAEESGRSVIEEWTESRRQALSVVVPPVYSKWMASTATTVLRSPPRPLKDWTTDFEDLRKELINKLRAGVNRTMTADFLGTHLEEADRETALTENISPGIVAPLESPATIDELLADRFGREYLAGARLTPKEKLVFSAYICLQGGDTLKAWAERHGMDPATARVHKMKAMAKLRAAKKLP